MEERRKAEKNDSLRVRVDTEGSRSLLILILPKLEALFRPINISRSREDKTSCDSPNDQQRLSSMELPVKSKCDGASKGRMRLGWKKDKNVEQWKMWVG